MSIPDAPLNPVPPLPSYTLDSFLQVQRAPLGHLLVEKQLREAGFRGGISTDTRSLDAYSTDESIFAIRPQIIIQPKDQHDVEVAVQIVASMSDRFPALSLTPRAAGTGLSGGSLTDSIVIDTTANLHHFGTVHTNGSVVTFTCEPGTPWRVVERQLRKHHVYLPPAPASKDVCTVGGAVANNAAGPDSLRYGHLADWIESLDVTLYDGHTYTIAPLTYKQYKNLITEKHAYADLAKTIFTLIERHEKLIQTQRPQTRKNTAGYALWDVIDTTVKSFKKGSGHFDLTKLIAGSQGTIGIITALTLRTAPIDRDTSLIAIPLFERQQIGDVINALLTYEPRNLELYDAHTYDLALAHPDFFQPRLGKLQFYQTMYALYATYHVRYRRRLPAFTLLVTLDKRSLGQRTAAGIVKSLHTQYGVRAREITNSAEAMMHWQLRRASYALAKLHDPKKRPAAFLEDMTIPPAVLPKFLAGVDKLFKKYHVYATVHGHGGDGHLHFYPLLDFSSKLTPKLITKMADEFFALATDLGGSICGEHNDGIIRTPYLTKMFSKPMMNLFATLEHAFDPQDIFNPGKKVHPRYDISTSIRTRN